MGCYVLRRQEWPLRPSLAPINEEGPLTCPFCGGQDTRRHRILQCPHFEHLRVKWDAPIPLQSLPASALEFGLWPDIDEARPFQAACDSISFPTVDQVAVEQTVETFTDGSCLHPKDKALRIAAGAVVVSHDGQPVTVWKGLLGGQQSIFRAEVLAGAVAVGSFSKVHVFSDCLSFVRIARRLASDWCDGRRPRMPSKHRDLWQYFWRHLTRCDQGNVEFSWVPSHQALGQLVGREAFEAQHNAVADAEAKSVLAAFVQRSEAYRSYVERFQFREICAKKLASLHAAIAYRAVAGAGGPPRTDPPSWTSADFRLDHPIGLALCGRAGPFGHPEYLSKLETFFSEVCSMVSHIRWWAFGRHVVDRTLRTLCQGYWGFTACLDRGQMGVGWGGFCCHCVQQGVCVAFSDLA